MGVEGSTDRVTASARVSEAQHRAEERLRRQRDFLRPLGWAVIAVVVASAATQRPAPGPATQRIALATAVVTFAATTAVAAGRRFVARSIRWQVLALMLMAAAGVALSWLQPRGATDLAPGAAAWMAIVRLPLTTGIILASGAGLGQAAAAARTGSASAVAAALLLIGLLGMVAYLMRQSRESQAETELLLARLADARDAQAEAAVVAERGRIAAELHDVLAHTLSGAALQLQGARLLAERQDAPVALRTAIQDASRLVADGLVNARQAVQTLRGSDLPSLEHIERLVAESRRDLQLPTTLHVEGTPRALAPESGLALYRGVQEALTNAARHAPGARTQVRVLYAPECVTVQVENSTPQAGTADTADPPRTDPARLAQLAELGGGNGLAGLGERVHRAGGTLAAGPTAAGWLVTIAIPTNARTATDRP